MAVIKHTKKEKEYQENNDTLVTFGEEAYTMRKDDPRTEEAIKKSKKLKEKYINSALLSGEISVFEGLNLSDTRENDENFEDYKARRKINRDLYKIYNTLGVEECKKQYPMGFKYAIIQQLKGENEARHEQPQMTATITNEDGTTQEAKVIINNDKE